MVTRNERGTTPEPRLRRVAIVDDHLMVLEGLRVLLDSIGGYEVVLASTDGKTFTQELAKGLLVDVALVDPSMPGMDGFEVVRWMRKFRPDIPALMVSVTIEHSWVRRAIRSGARGYLPKNLGRDQLRRALAEVAEWGRHYNDLVIESMEGAAKGQEIVLSGTVQRIDWAKLPRRELEFLRLLMDPADLKYEVIAERMGVSRSMVDHYFHWFTLHYGVHSQTALIRLAAEWFDAHDQGPAPH